MRTTDDAASIAAQWVGAPHGQLAHHAPGPTGLPAGLVGPRVEHCFGGRRRRLAARDEGVEVDRRRIWAASRDGCRYASARRPAPVPSAIVWWIFHTIADRPPARPSIT